MAASRIAGITIEIGGDTTNLQKALKGIDTQLKTTQKELKDVDKLLRFDPSNTELLRQKQARLASAISDTKSRLDELKKAQDNVEKGTKEWDALQREIIATEQDLNGLEEQMNDFGSVSAQKIAAAGKQVEEFGGKLEKAGDALAPLSTAAAGALAGLGGLALKTVQSADELATLSKQTGLSVEELQKMQYASDFVDVSLENMTGALKKLKPKITEDNKALADLGVETKNADGTTRDAVDVFYDTIEALSKIQNETERDQKAMEIFGKSADELAGIIDDGGASLKQYGKEAEDLGLIMGEDTVDSLNSVNDVIDKLKKQGGGALAKLGGTVAKTLAPTLEKLVGIVGKVTDAIAKLTPEQAEMILKVLAVTASISPLLKVGGKLTKGIGTVMKLAPKIVTGVKLVMAALSPTTLIIAAVVAAVVALGVIIYKNWDKIKAWTLDMVAKVKAAWENLKTAVSNTVANVKDAVVNTWNNIKTAVTNTVTNIKTSVVNIWNNIKTTVSNLATNIKNAVVNAWTNAKSGVVNALSNLKSSISEKWENIKSTVSEKVEGIVKKVKDFFTFDFELPSLKLPTWEDMKLHFENLIKKIKGVFDFNWELPKIKLPHITVTGTWEAPYGIGGRGSVPKLGISWYRKAYQNPVMFTQPTVLQTPQGYKGFGDGAGAEIVMGLNKLRELVGAGGVTVNVYGAQGQSVDALADAVTRRIVNLQSQRNRAYA